MKKNISNIIITFLCFVILTLSAKALTESTNSNSVIVQFVTTNGFGNNLYIDNLTIGARDSISDIAVLAINNINKDTTYLPGVPSYTFSPIVTVANLGTNTNGGSFTVWLSIGNYNYLDSVDTSLSAGQATNIQFPLISITPNKALNILVYLSNLPTGETNHTNDTLRQTSVFINGAVRNVLFEEFTSTTSVSCTSNDPNLDNYINLNYNTICGIKYHLGFPIPGNDSMYLPDSTQLIQRSNYYFINSVPQGLADGIYRIPLPFSYTPNIDSAYNKRIIMGSPLSLTVNDTRLSGDTIQTTINLNNLFNLPVGDYRLRIMALERSITYANPPGNNGETQFYDVFRQAFPDSAGILINPLAGNYTFIYKYVRKPNWADSMIYTVAFVQNDNTKEVLNCAKARNLPLANAFVKKNSVLPVIYRPDVNNISKFIPKYPRRHTYYADTGIVSFFNYELFEGVFPPPGWYLSNPDKGLTFEKVNGVNGTSLGGSSCIRMRFYDYPNFGQKDTLTSIPFYNVTSTDSLKFDRAYAQYLSAYADTLTVNISIDGGNTYTTIFQEGGHNLSTSPSTTLPFTPVSANDWLTYSYPMSAILPFSANPGEVRNYDLLPNYPNPFNPKTTIKFQIPNSSIVTIKIYDLLGREVKQLLNQRMNKGTWTVEFDANNLASGIYFCKMVAGDFLKVRKLALIK